MRISPQHEKQKGGSHTHYDYEDFPTKGGGETAALLKEKKDPRWWKKYPVRQVCPVSRFPICLLSYPPYKLRDESRDLRGPSLKYVLVDAKYLALQVICSGVFKVGKQRCLQLRDLLDLDEHLDRCALTPLRVTAFYQLCEAAQAEGDPKSQHREEILKMRNYAARELVDLKKLQEKCLSILPEREVLQLQSNRRKRREKHHRNSNTTRTTSGQRMMPHDRTNNAMGQDQGQEKQDDDHYGQQHNSASSPKEMIAAVHSEPPEHLAGDLCYHLAGFVGKHGKTRLEDINLWMKEEEQEKEEKEEKEKEKEEEWCSSKNTGAVAKFDGADHQQLLEQQRTDWWASAQERQQKERQRAIDQELKDLEEQLRNHEEVHDQQALGGEDPALAQPGDQPYYPCGTQHQDHPGARHHYLHPPPFPHHGLAKKGGAWYDFAGCLDQHDLEHVQQPQPPQWGKGGEATRLHKTTESFIGKLERLAILRFTGALTNEEFQAAKAKSLGI